MKVELRDPPPSGVSLLTRILLFRMRGLSMP